MKKNIKPHHAALTVSDIETSIEWYRSKLGFEVLQNYEKHGMKIAHLARGGVRIELFDYGERRNRCPSIEKS